MGTTNTWERHEQSPILHEPAESPNLGFSEQLSAQGMTTLSVVTTGPLWAGTNVCRLWVSPGYSQEITWVVFPHEARVELTSSCAPKTHPADGGCCLVAWAAQGAQPGRGLSLAWDSSCPVAQLEPPFSANQVLNYLIAFLGIP